MKNCFIFLMLAHCQFIYGQYDNKNIFPGMHVRDFKKIVPGLIPESSSFNESISMDEKIGDIEGTWYYSFSNDTLYEMFYSRNLGRYQNKRNEVYAQAELAYGVLEKKLGKSVFGQGSGGSENDHTRISDKDTISFRLWRTHDAEIIAGLYFTGNTPLHPKPNAYTMNAPEPREYYLFTIQVNKGHYHGATGEWKIFPGQTVKQVAANNPALFPKGTGLTGSFDQGEEIFGEDFGALYTFAYDTLTHISLSSYSEYNKPEFENGWKTAQKIIKKYTELYGKPKITNNKPGFNDKMQNGYNILDAYWIVNGSWIRVSYQLTGGKAGNHYILSITRGQGNKPE